MLELNVAGNRSKDLFGAFADGLSPLKRQKGGRTVNLLTEGFEASGVVDDSCKNSLIIYK
jgi:hypothetical protein